MAVLNCFFALFLAQYICLIIYYWFFHHRFFSPLRELPTPPGANLFMGHAFQFFNKHPGDVARTWVSQFPDEGVVRYLKVFNLERVAVLNPAALADVLVHKCYDFEKPALLRNRTSRILGVGLFLAEGDMHKRQRKILNSAFHFRHIKGLYPIFWNMSQKLVSMMYAAGNISVDVSDTTVREIEVNGWASRATLDIIGVAALGREFNSLQDPDNELSTSYRTIFTPTTSSMIVSLLSLFLPLSILYNVPIQHNLDVSRSAALVKRMCQSVIDEKRSTLEQDEADDIDILGVALRSGDFSDDELINQMMTFLVAGHETTAAALTWAVYELCKNPTIQSTLRKEVQSELPNPWDRSSTVTSTQIDRLPYLNAVCNETLRVYPPVPITAREAVVDTTVAGRVIPKGTTVVIPPCAVNASKSLWGADAASFNPGRWLRARQASSGGAESNYSLLTFLRGPRSCIGEKFARAEFACLVAAWVSAFETEIVDADIIVEPEVGAGVSIKPRGGLHVRIKPVGR